MSVQKTSERPLIETIGLKKYFPTAKGNLHAVDNVNLSIGRGKTLGVVGESGCGKSTLGRTILRLTGATGGQVLYDGRDILKMTPLEMEGMRKHMQIIFQDPYASLNPRMTVSEIIADPIRVCRTITDEKRIGEKVSELMETVGLADRFVNTYPHELDGGRRQRIGVARALSLDPEFIVCDEPVSALDVSIQAQILNLLMDLQDRRGFTYMFITHDLSVVKHISDDIAVMYLGQCVERAPSRELFKNPSHPYTQALLAAIPLPSLKPENRLGKAIKGEVTSPIEPKPACRFAPRCPKVIPRCLEAEVPLRPIADDHFVACVLY